MLWNWMPFEDTDSAASKTAGYLPNAPFFSGVLRGKRHPELTNMGLERGAELIFSYRNDFAKVNNGKWIGS